MTRYIVRRLLWLPLLLLAVSVITFALGLYGPGDPVQVLMGQHSNPETVARIRQERGLDRPFHEQYVLYVAHALQGDLGESYKYRGQPIGPLILDRIWVSVQLGLVALAMAVFLGVPLGVLAALKANTWVDRLTVGLTVAGISTPTFVLAPIVTWFFARQLRVLPAGGWDGIFSTKIIMPALVLGLGAVAVFARQTRASLLEVLNQDYVRTARAKGLRERTVIVGHALRNALLPIFTLLGMMLGDLPAGAFIVENVYGIPGIGRLGFESFFARDYPLIMALTLIVAASYVLVNLVVDVGYVFLDPRIRYA
jgi:ABC-type dipeptide/oligopeptide/nickel transport system permease component